jgi:4-aminobutyrate aminotransferase-like enzyme
MIKFLESTVAAYSFSREPKEVKAIQTENREIKTKIPAPGTCEILEKLDKYESRSMHGQLPIIWDKAIDHNVFDHLGNKWIDFTSMIFVANVGHGNKHVISKVEEVLKNPLTGCYAYPNKTRADYLERLVRFAGPNFQKAFLLSAGTETTEAAFKLMKMHGQKIGKNKNVVIAGSGNWHGRTLAAQMLSDNVNQKKWTNHDQNDIVHIPFPYPWVLNGKSAIEFLRESLKVMEEKGIYLREDVCGVMLETFQGWGAIFYPREYVQELRRICDKNNILLCFDEMQSGFGRTGKNFGYEHYGVVADLICCGKGMGGGFPLSGVVGRSHIMDLPETGNMSSTHSGHPVMCAAGLGVLDELENRNLVKESERKGQILHSKIKEINRKFPKAISGTYGEGLIASIIFHTEENKLQSFRKVSILAEMCMQKGLLVVHTGRESIKIGPPLTITDEALIEGIEIISESIQEVYNDFWS